MFNLKENLEQDIQICLPNQKAVTQKKSLMPTSVVQ